MLAKKYRLQKNRQFGYVYKRGSHKPFKYFVLFYCDRRDKRISIGFSVSNKLGKACVRNKIKRILRESVRANLNLAQKGRTYIFCARNTIIDADYQTIKNAVSTALKSLPQKGGIKDKDPEQPDQSQSKVKEIQ